MQEPAQVRRQSLKPWLKHAQRYLKYILTLQTRRNEHFRIQDISKFSYKSGQDRQKPFRQALQHRAGRSPMYGLRFVQRHLSGSGILRYERSQGASLPSERKGRRGFQDDEQLYAVR